MGLIKLSSIYKKNKKETSPAPEPSLPSLELNLNLEEPHPQQLNSVSETKGSLLDDIFTELTVKPNIEEDNLKDDFSLALALSQQLSLEEEKTNKIAGVTKTNNNKESKDSSSSSSSSRSFLLGTDSIYSSYLRNMSAVENTNSMFDSLLNKTSATEQSQTNVAITRPTNTATPEPIINKAVLDSDISDSDEESVRSVDSEDKRKRGKKPNEGKRMTKGPQPIMERRGPQLLAQRKAESNNNNVDVNESVIQRMKDRHRNQAKLAALRHQEEEQQQNYMIYSSASQPIIPQNYGFPYSPTMVLPPQSGFMMDPNHMFYAPVNNDYHQQSYYHSPPPPLSVPSGFLPPPPKHVSATGNLKKEERHEESSKPPRMVKSFSTPTQRHSQKSAPTTPGLEPYTMTSSSTLESIQEYESSQENGSSDDEKRVKSKTTKKGPRDNDGEPVPPIRSSRSTPNLKKKKSTKKSNKSKPTSSSNNRRNSQENLNRSSLRHMKSEPEIAKQSQHYHYSQQQQLNTEWERMHQTYQPNPYYAPAYHYNPIPYNSLDTSATTNNRPYYKNPKQQHH